LLETWSCIFGLRTGYLNDGSGCEIDRGVLTGAIALERLKAQKSTSKSALLGFNTCDMLVIRAKSVLTQATPWPMGGSDAR
jgi:hypothetical protein